MQETHKSRNTHPKIERECNVCSVAYILLIVHLSPFSLPCFLHASVESILAVKALEDHFPDLRILQTRRIDGCHVKLFSFKKNGLKSEDSNEYHLYCTHYVNIIKHMITYNIRNIINQYWYIKLYTSIYHIR